MQDSYLNQLLRLNIYRYWSISWFHLSVMTYFWWIHPNLDKFHDMKSVFKLGSAIPSAFSASRKSYGPKHQEPGLTGPSVPTVFYKTWYCDVFIFLVLTWYRSTGSFDNTTLMHTLPSFNVNIKLMSGMNQNLENNMIYTIVKRFGLGKICF